MKKSHAKSARKKVFCSFILPMYFIFRSQVLAASTESHFGSRGSYTVVVDSSNHPTLDEEKVYFFHPAETEERVPVILFLHGIGATDPATYSGLIEHMVSRGYAVIYTNFSSRDAVVRPNAAYAQMWSGIEQGLTTWGPYIDKSRAGFVGHSYGGGAVPYITRRAMAEKRIGKKAAFMYIMAPWYSHRISNRQLRHLPRHLKMIVEVFADDDINDHRMADFLFRTTALPATAKNFIVVNGDSVNGAMNPALHELPCGSDADKGAQLRINGIYRMIDALAEYSFDKSCKAGLLCMGNGSLVQRYMGLRPNNLTITGDPIIERPQSSFLNFWSHSMNPHARYSRLFGSVVGGTLNTPRTIIGYLSFLGNANH